MAGTRRIRVIALKRIRINRTGTSPQGIRPGDHAW
jgi:hypothetical protein